MTRRMMTSRAETMVLWYRDQPERATRLSDAEVAERLAACAPHEGWTNRNGQGNKTLVRSVRQWIDRQVEGEFADDHFGTRSTNGGWSHLRTGVEAILETMIGAAGQAAATEQRTRREMETRARESMKWKAQAKAFCDLNNFNGTDTCGRAADEVERTGVLSPKTRAELKLLGLL